MYKYNIEKIINGVNNIKLSKKDRAISLYESEYGGPVLYAIFIGTLISIAIPCFSFYIINWKSIISWLSSTAFVTFSIYYFILFSNKDKFFSEKSKKYIICKQEIDEYVTSLPEQYKEEAINKLADQTWADGGNLSAKGFFEVYNYFLPKITEINEKKFKDDFIKSFGNKITIQSDKQALSIEK